MHIIIHQHIYIPSRNISSTSYSYNNHQHIYIYQFINHVILDNKPILRVLSSNPVLNPSSQFYMNNYNNYMINSVSELYNLKLENISPTLTLDYCKVLRILLFSWFYSSLGSPKASP